MLFIAFWNGSLELCLKVREIYNTKAEKTMLRGPICSYIAAFLADLTLLQPIRPLLQANSSLVLTDKSMKFGQ
jgi:hypothetical protein